MKFSPSCMEAMWERWRSLALTHSHSHPYNSCTQGSATVSLGSAGKERCFITKLSNLYKTLSRLTKQQNQKENIHGGGSREEAAV